VTGDIGLESLRLYHKEPDLLMWPGILGLKVTGFIAKNLIY
jgi:hypothetical protein